MLHGQKSQSQNEKGEAVIFCLHDIGGKGKYSVSIQEFNELLSLLKNKYHVTSMRDFLSNTITTGKKNIVLTFDDGYPSHVEIAIPRLTALNMGATFYLYLDRFGKKSQNLSKFTGLPQIFEIGSHGFSHKLSNGWDKNKFFREVYISRKQLEYATGNKILSWAWPYGDFSEGQPELIFAAGYISQVSTHYRIASKAKDRVYPRFTLTQPNPIKQAKEILKLYESG